MRIENRAFGSPSSASSASTPRQSAAAARRRALGERVGERFVGAGGGFGLGARAPAGFGPVGEFGELLPDLVRQLDERVGLPGIPQVTPFEPPEDGETILDPSQSRGRRLDRFPTLPNRGGQIFNLGEQIAAPLEQARRLRVRCCGLVEGAAGPGQLAGRRVLRSVKRLVRGLQQPQQPLGLAESPALGQEGFLFARLRGGALDFVQSALHRGALGAGAPKIRLEPVAPLLRFPKPPPGGPRFQDERPMTPRGVHRVPRRAGLQEGQVLPLAVDLGKQDTEAAERGHRRRRSVDGRPVREGSSAGPEPQFPPDDDFAVGLNFAVGRRRTHFGEQTLQRVRLPHRGTLRGKPGLDHGAGPRRIRRAGPGPAPPARVPALPAGRSSRRRSRR